MSVSDANEAQFAQMRSTINNNTFSSNLGSTIKSGQTMQGAGKKSLIGRLVSLEEKAAEVSTSLTQVQQQTRDATTFASNMRSSLAASGVDEHKQALTRLLSEVTREMNVQIQQNQTRTQKLWSVCQTLAKTSESVKDAIKELSERALMLEHFLGVYVATE